MARRCGLSPPDSANTATDSLVDLCTGAARRAQAITAERARARRLAACDRAEAAAKSAEAAAARRKKAQSARAVAACVEINQCVGCTRQFNTKSFLGDDVAVLARSSGEEPASPRHRAGVASMAWRTTRRFSTNAP